LFEFSHFLTPPRVGFETALGG